MLELLYLYYFFVFFLGAIFGSFLNVIVFELEKNVFSGEEKEWGIEKTNKSFWERINRRSACPICKHTLKPLELVPIFSYIFLTGKCSSCKHKISPRYILVEIFSGILFTGFFYYLMNNAIMVLPDFNLYLQFLASIPIISSLILIFLFDLKHKIIPDMVLFPFFIYSIFYLLFFGIVEFSFSGLGKMFLYAALFSFPFWSIWFLSKGRAMGFADWKLIFTLSIFFILPSQNLLFIFLSFWIGAIYSVPALLLKKKLHLSSEIPFGPFIILSFFIVLFFNLSYFSFLNLLNF